MELHITCFSPLDKTIYTVNEIVHMAKECKKFGASTVHFHMDKLASDMDFLRVVKELEKEEITLSVSRSDFERLSFLLDKNPRNIKYVAMHTSNCQIFNSYIMQPFHNVEQQYLEYVKFGVIPELHIFNEQGAANCVLLARKYGYNFLPVVNMGYPNEMNISYKSIEEIIEKLKDFPQIMFVLFNNTDSDYYSFIIRLGLGIRIGLEDNMYCGEKKAINCIDSARYIQQILDN